MSYECSRCGRSNHLRKNCFALFHENGYYLGDDSDIDDWSTDDSDTDYLGSDDDE